MNSRDLVRRYFRRQPVDRIPFLPVAFYQAARIDGAPASELIDEPPRLARAAIELSRLIASDAVAVRLEAAVYAHCGLDYVWPAPDDSPAIAGHASGMPDAAGLVAGAGHLLATVAAIKGELRGEKQVLAVVPGPAALSRRFGDEAAQTAAAGAIRALADAVCKAGAEIVVLEEAGSDDEARLKRLAGPIVNTVRYYSAAVILSVPRPVGSRIADALLVPAGAASPPAGAPFGMFAPRTALTDQAARAELAGRVASRKGEIFLALDDAAMAGVEFPDIAAAASELLGR